MVPELFHEYWVVTHVDFAASGHVQINGKIIDLN
jgi:hypothetical protein